MKKKFIKVTSTLTLCTGINELYSTKMSLKTKLYTIIWVAHGTLDLLVDDNIVSIKKGQMIFITPISHLKIIDNNSEVNILQFNREFYCIKENDHEISCNGILFFGSQGNPLISLDKKTSDSFNVLVKILFEEFTIKDNIQEEMLTVILKRWLIKCTRILKKQKNFVGEKEVKLELVRQFRILLEMNYKKYHKVSDYAQLLNKSPKTLSNRFKSLDLLSPKEMIIERIFTEAKRYLLFTELSIKEIAFNLGFDDIPSFSHFFKNRANISPKQFKINQRKK